MTARAAQEAALHWLLRWIDGPVRAILTGQTRKTGGFEAFSGGER
ncbi:hypothetical protein EIO_0371 [Ketogulonicigenium vulgare Y25]|uniref:Uncharacterized protein n=1 Tax=Ketogulonicigenium vulgare (strain WSH-001) TaxID=759362 RepID=F9Y9A7_KETVW|nr:hypothetical protein EIO_0371 [Ketogulonicigenium vulgare Y25]AEM41324.1 hypothetical protein KVU_1485 [Ketogulonicigenium vulgare WSH-001]ALJ81464.1 hypothetical protein KVH_09915 [Ketogulonicigenium vulgare]ANW35093.1 hypothetical protein KvSKV_09860 [Ketogulonicigenium vulgare]AOZ55065.1 hypothetical protein KVC_2058 [Ketogulonicigenium vulgare]